eukprot:4627962-Amphidinium_carterae.1
MDVSHVSSRQAVGIHWIMKIIAWKLHRETKYKSNGEQKPENLPKQTSTRHGKMTQRRNA